jgi:hypothetical protein
VHDDAFSLGDATAFSSSLVTSVKQCGHASYASSGLRWRFKVLRGFAKFFPHAAFGQVKLTSFFVFSSVLGIASPPLMVNELQTYSVNAAKVNI